MTTRLEAAVANRGVEHPVSAAAPIGATLVFSVVLATAVALRRGAAIERPERSPVAVDVHRTLSTLTGR